MKKALVIIGLLGAAASFSGCIVETSCDGWTHDGICYRMGATCDFVGDQDCFDIQQLWYCHSDGLIYRRDCGVDCSGYAAACCGLDPATSYTTENCLCCMTADCASARCYSRDY